MKSFKEVNEEVKVTNKDLVKVLQSKDFGMTAAGGNGEAKIVKGKIQLKTSCFYGCSEKLKKFIAEWSPGGSYYEFFLKDYSVHLKIVGSDADFDGGNIYGKKADAGVLTLTMTV